MLSDVTRSALRSPRARRLFLEMVAGLTLLMVGVAALAWWAKDPMTRVSVDLVSAYGALGLMLGVVVADACPVPIPSAPILLVSYVGGMQFAAVWLLGGLASVAAGPLSYGLGATLGRSRSLSAWTDRAGIRPVMQRYGARLVFAAAISPFPYAATAWVAGATGVPFFPFLLACFGRLLKIGVYLGAAVLGWSF